MIAGCTDGGELVGLLYCDTPDTSFRLSDAHLSTFCSILGEGLRGLAEPASPRATEWETFLERTTPEEIERDRLLLLLNRNEWNISRVSRLLGVTRMTIYNRLDRFKIPREHVPKVVRRPVKA
jgi:transcriptional regulator of acetoin/glycerol metabolism